ncbi:MAG: hypothetical protein HC888_15305 [Candidatus Competibacteraceae bacterium]|nr:hypothetical protein [Candidatus Competibacteraceae bacterium]
MDGAFRWRLAPALLGGVLAAALAEFFSVVSWRGILDDNLVVPLFGAAGIAFVARQFTPELSESLLLAPGTAAHWLVWLFQST